jgi:Spy/CpxP family protein refolding chaperone
MKTWLIAAAFCLLAALSASAQVPPVRGGGRGEAPGAGEDPGISPAELQRMFDAYALMQAQEQLKINDENYAQFLTRFKALQDVRRRALVERTRRIMDLRRLGNDPRSDEGQIKTRLKDLADFELRAADEAAKAYAAVDQVLDVRQQAQFRAFEEMMERRKLELISRARQAARPKKQL